MALKNLEIITGDEVKECVGSEDLDHLVDLWMQETYEPNLLPVSKIRRKIEYVLNGIPMGSRLLAVMLGIREHLRDRFPQFSKTRKIQAGQKEMYRKGLTEHLRQAIERGDMVIAKKGDKIVGMVRVYKLDHVAPNDFAEGNVFEIGKALIIPEERRKGIYRKIREQMIAHVRKKYGDVPILAGTKSESIKKLNRADGWIEIGFEEYMRIYGNPYDYIESAKDDIKQDGWTAFLYIPDKEK